MIDYEEFLAVVTGKRSFPALPCVVDEEDQPAVQVFRDGDGTRPRGFTDEPSHTMGEIRRRILSALVDTEDESIGMLGNSPEPSRARCSSFPLARGRGGPDDTATFQVRGVKAEIDENYYS